MTTQNLNRNPRLTRALLQQAAPRIADFMLLDVGCSGGLHPLFLQFGDRLRAVGFDPMLDEVARLTAENTNPKLKYEAAFVGNKDYAKLLSPEAKAAAPNTDFFGRTSAARAAQLTGVTQAAQQQKFADKKVGLDDYCAEQRITEVDFIKVDTDGSDYEVLTGAEKLLTNGVLGASVEAQLHGPVHQHSNVFSNIDRFMRSKGFALFDFDIYRYSRAVLPLPFYYDLFGQTRGGAVSWGEAVYFRDLTDPDYEKHWNVKITPEDVLKLACLFDLYGMPDCAAELILKRPEAFEAAKRDDYLNLLVPPMSNVRSMSYQEYTGVFELHPDYWYPSRGLFGR
jgi:FkbM family methyltransferase